MIKYNQTTTKYEDGTTITKIYNTPVVAGYTAIKKTTASNKPQEVIEANRLNASVSRTRKNFWDKIRANKWEYAATFTFDATKVDRYSYKECQKKITKWLDNQKSKNAPNLKYILVAEQCEDGAIHFHAVFSEIANMILWPTNEVDGNNRQVFELDGFKLGFNWVTAIDDINKWAGYMIKALKETVANIDGRVMMATRNLKKGEVTKEFVSDIEEAIAEIRTDETVVVISDKSYKFKNGTYDLEIRYIITKSKVGGAFDARQDIKACKRE